jgi:(E)-4-hydroxy-3-methyl-but-2-enyl pyrophosphate reductase
MEVTVGKTAGFCSGVQRAIQGLRKRLGERTGLYCLGEFIHNPEVIETLESLGMIVVQDIEAIPDGRGIIIRTHGLPREILDRAAGKGLEVFDFTCPKVKKTHHLVIELTEEGYQILIIGNASHPEVRALHSMVRNNSRVLEKLEDTASLQLEEPVAVVVQTTFNPDTFNEILTDVVARSKRTLVCNTLCEETIRRQREAVDLAGEVDFIVVVGGRNSSNTRTLFRRVQDQVRAVHVERAEELDELWFEGVRRVGVVSGASTPVEEVQKVHERLMHIEQEGSSG